MFQKEGQLKEAEWGLGLFIYMVPNNFKPPRMIIMILMMIIINIVIFSNGENIL